jgi:hypothetical protein
MHEFDSPVFRLDKADYSPVLKMKLVLSRKTNFDFQEVTDRIGLLPTRTRSYEDYPQVSRDMGYAGAVWVYYTEEEECRDVNEQLLKLKGILHGKEQAILDIVQQFDLNVSIVVIVNGDVAHMPAFWLSTETIAFAASINAEVSFDMYIDNANPDDIYYSVPQLPGLPIGSVIQLKGGEKKLMIIGRVQIDTSTGKRYDYAACLYPEGIIDSKHTVLFNNDAIDRLFYIGYESDENDLLTVQILGLDGEHTD